MKRLILLVFLLDTAFTMAACAQTRENPSAGPEIVVEDQASFLAALKKAGTNAEVADSIEQPFFTPEGINVSVNGADVQVFEYESQQALEAEAAQVAPDGGSIGTNSMMWVDAPHFFKAGRIIVLYVGSDTATLKLLESVLGPQFAGR